MLEYGKGEFDRGRILSYDDLRSESLPRWNHLSKVLRDQYKQNALLRKDEIIKGIDSIHIHDAKVAQKKREQNNAKNQRVKDHLNYKMKADGKA